LVEVAKLVGAEVAVPGDWIVHSATGSYHVTRSLAAEVRHRP
jgi:hypothetical protein